MRELIKNLCRPALPATFNLLQERKLSNLKYIYLCIFYILIINYFYYLLFIYYNVNYFYIFQFKKSSLLRRFMIQYYHSGKIEKLDWAEHFPRFYFLFFYNVHSSNFP